MALVGGRRSRRRGARLRLAAGDAAPRRLVAHVLPGERADRRAAPRHQRLCLRGDRRVAPLPRHRRLRFPRGALAGARAGHRLRPRLAATRRRARLVGRPRRDAGALRAADRLLLGVLQPALRHRLRRRSSGASAPTGSSPPAACGTPSRYGSDGFAPQGRVRHGLVLPGARRRTRAGDGLGPHRRAMVRVRDRGARRALRLGSPVGDGGRDGRVRHGAAARSGAATRRRPCSPGSSSSAAPTGRTRPASVYPEQSTYPPERAVELHRRGDRARRATPSSGSARPAGCSSTGRSPAGSISRPSHSRISPEGWEGPRPARRRAAGSDPARSA